MATYNFTVRAEDDRGAFSDRTFSIQVQNNLVDRMLLVDNNHAYASVDGVNFTERTGKGGRRVHYMLGKWVVIQDNNTYRISNDTINWEENLKFKTIADDPNINNRNIEFWCDDGTFFEYGGYVYIIGWMRYTTTAPAMNTSIPTSYRSKMAIFRTQDWNNWNMVDGSASFGGLNNSSELYDFSNIDRFNGEFLFYSHNDKAFYLSSDFSTFRREYVINPTATPLNNYKNIGTLSVNSVLRYDFLRLAVINNIVKLQFNTAARDVVSTNNNGNSGFVGTIRQAGLVLTTDLNNIIVPQTNNSIENSLQSPYAAGVISTTGNTLYTISDREKVKIFTPKLPKYFNGDVIFTSYIPGVAQRNTKIPTSITNSLTSQLSPTDTFYMSSAYISSYNADVRNFSCVANEFDGYLYSLSRGLFSRGNNKSTPYSQNTFVITGVTNGVSSLRFTDFAVRG